MATNTSIKEDIQNLNVGSPLVELFELDLTNKGGGVFYFTPQTQEGGGYVTFNGNDYSPVPIEATGFEWKSDGKMPRPTLTVSNVTLLLLATVVQYNDLVGGKIIRRRTYAKYLDGEPTADVNAQFPIDIFYVERKTQQNKNLITFELKVSIDVETLLIPKRQIISYCDYRYRIWDGISAFDYTYATCPYTGSNYFDINGDSCAAADDKCGKKLFDCRLRYSGSSTVVPGRFFPGIGAFGGSYRN